MEFVKSKDAALSLNVSQTTVKRWASFYPNVFRKDRFGHYIFNDYDLELLAFIKSAIERGETMEHIQLPVAQPVQTVQPAQPRLREAFLETAASSELLHAPEDDLFTRMMQMERRLDQKADEVVNVQIRQHREELEELRHMIERLTASMELAREPIPSLQELRRSFPETKAPVSAASRKRGLFRSMFVWF